MGDFTWGGFVNSRRRHYASKVFHGVCDPERHQGTSGKQPAPRDDREILTFLPGSSQLRPAAMLLICSGYKKLRQLFQKRR